MRKRNLLFGRECSLLLDLFVSTKIHPREIKINDMCNRFSKTLSRILCKWKQDSVVSLFLYDNGQNCFFTQSCPFHYFLFCICYGMNASIISVGLPSSVNAPRRYLLGLHSGSQ